MTRKEQLEFCSVCQKRGFNPKHGIICGITSEPASFSGTCPDYLEDEHEVRMEDTKKESMKSETTKTINKGRVALFIIAGLYTIVGFMEAFTIQGHELIFGVIDWFIAAVFVGLGIWSYRKASLAMIIGLVFYVLIVLLLALVEPSTIVSGILWKILIVTYLVYGIKTAREEEAKNKTKPMTDLLDQI